LAGELIRKQLTTLGLFAVAAVAAVQIWSWAASPPPFASYALRSDGVYIEIDLRGEVFEQVCLKHGNYGSVSSTMAIPCISCVVSEETRRLIAADEGGPLRLAVWRGNYFDVYEIEMPKAVAEARINFGRTEPDSCSKSAISLARCRPADGEEDCVFEFARFPDPEIPPR